MRGLLAEVLDLILEARQQTARTVNAGLTLLYWQVGDRIHREILRGRRAEYGAEIMLTLSAQLELEFGRGFGEKNLRRKVQLAEVFPDREIVVSLIRQLTWTHFGQMELYLRWLNRHERQKGEEKPIGLLLYAGKKRETVEVLELEPRGIHVAEYLMELPPRELLEQRLHEAAVRTRLRLDQQTTSGIGSH